MKLLMFFVLPQFLSVPARGSPTNWSHDDGAVFFRHPDGNLQPANHSSTAPSCPGIKFIENLVHTTSSAGTSTAAAIKELPLRQRASGHGSSAAMKLLMFFVLPQVSKQKPCHCFKSDNVCLVMLPCPEACIESFRVLLLLLSGDVERNPGPMSKPQEEQLLSLQETVDKHKNSHAILQQEVNLLKEKQKQSEQTVSTLEERLNKLASELDALKQKDTSSAATTEPQLTAALNELSQLKTRCDDAEGRSRRCNLLFFGITDADKETWAQSECLVTSLCSEKLNVQVESSRIERAHRLGAFDPQKCRPIIVKFSSFKDKDSVLSSAHKLKGTRVAISEDFPISVRLARRHLLDFARPKGTPYRLRHDKLFINDKCYVFDAALGAVKEKDT
ncbi:uncharacterized protein LOC115315791 [Ixodes scapularis]|uniref:uncharacterized protein LOC115315791 n=1 Tax=Ixodes scapularis TaxID=6945 RepID=UPI001C38168D|nr:uncharacterized protein LOC115315791 [Ixodes scapularis]